MALVADSQVGLPIFQDKSVTDILSELFKERGLKDFDLRTQATYAPRDYCVQYNETDYNFVSRLMEQYGIFYFFEHDATKHTMVLADGAGAHKPCPHQSTVTYDYMNVAADDDDVIRMLEVQQEVRAGRYSITDYNFTTPALNLMASAASASVIPVGKSLELFEYPGEYEKKAEGESLAKVRIQEEEAPSITITGESICRAFVPGFRLHSTRALPPGHGWTLYPHRCRSQSFGRFELYHFAVCGR